MIAITTSNSISVKPGRNRRTGRLLGHVMTPLVDKVKEGKR